MIHLVLAILLLGLLLPSNASAGGIAVRAPTDLTADACAQGQPVAFTGVRTEPVPPTAIGCIKRGEHRTLVAVTRDRGFRAAEICLFVIPAGEEVVDGSCTRLGEIVHNADAGPPQYALRVMRPLALPLGASEPFTIAPDVDQRADLVSDGIEALVGALGKVLASASIAADDRFLAFSQTPRDPAGPASNLMGRRGIAGRSAHGKPIYLRQYGDPEVDGELLIFGCTHGDECAAREMQPITGCPMPDADIYKVGNLNPDGYAGNTRLNGRGVDLNRNFPAGWKPIGRRGSPQYSGPHPFSEPETRLAARIIRRLDPEATIWFHQHAGPAFVRAWGQSVPLARRYAQLAKLPFRRMPWLAGTAPNWQNHAFPGTASFVVELPDGAAGWERLAELGSAAAHLGQEIARGESK